MSNQLFKSFVNSKKKPQKNSCDYDNYIQRCNDLIADDSKMTVSFLINDFELVQPFHHMISKENGDIDTFSYGDMVAQNKRRSDPINLIKQFGLRYNRHLQLERLKKDDTVITRTVIQNIANRFNDWNVGLQICNPIGGKPGMVVLYVDKMLININKYSQERVYSPRTDHIDIILEQMSFCLLDYLLSTNTYNTNGIYKAKRILTDKFKFKGDYMNSQFTKEQVQQDVETIMNKIQNEEFSIQELFDKVQTYGLSDEEMQQAEQNNEKVRKDFELKLQQELEKEESIEKKRLADGKEILERIASEQESAKDTFKIMADVIKVYKSFEDDKDITPYLLEENLYRLVNSLYWQSYMRDQSRSVSMKIPIQAIADALLNEARIDVNIYYVLVNNMTSPLCNIRMTNSEFDPNLPNEKSEKADQSSQTSSEDFSKEVKKKSVHWGDESLKEETTQV